MPTENPKIFISYSWADRDIVWPLAGTLSAKGLEVLIDKREIQPGDRITEQVQKALVECDTLLLMWSQSSSLSDYVTVKIWKIAPKVVYLIKNSLVTRHVTGYINYDRQFQAQRTGSALL